jgi:hypothetical protein
LKPRTGVPDPRTGEPAMSICPVRRVVSGIVAVMVSFGLEKARVGHGLVVVYQQR